MSAAPAPEPAGDGADPALGGENAYPRAERTFSEADDRLALAQQLLARAVQLVEGGPGWLYLTTHRHLPADAVRAASSELRDLEPIVPGRLAHEHATVSLLRDAAGVVSGFQLSFHDVLGRPSRDESGRPKRQSYSLRPSGCKDGLFTIPGMAGSLAGYLVEGRLEKVIACAAAGLRARLRIRQGRSM